jgi:hypothetical protein
LIAVFFAALTGAFVVSWTFQAERAFGLRRKALQTTDNYLSTQLLALGCPEQLWADYFRV